MKATFIQHFRTLVCAAYASAAAPPSITVTLDSASAGLGKFTADAIRIEAAAQQGLPCSHVSSRFFFCKNECPRWVVAVQN